MRAELEARAAQALELARRAGADEAFASASRTRGVSVEVRDGRIDKLEESTGRGLSLKLYVEGRYATFRTSDLREEPLARFVRDAVSMTRALERDPFRAIPDPSLYEGRSSAALDLVDGAIPSLDTATRIAWCMELHERCAHPRLVSATVGVNDAHTLTASASSNGFAGFDERTLTTRGGTVTLSDEGDARPAGSHWITARKLGELEAPRAVGDEALRQAVRRLGARTGPTRRTHMVVEPRVAGRLLGLLLDPANAAAFSQERSFWRGREGVRLVAERLVVHDEPLLPRGLGSRTFDGEGIAARRLAMIEGGALRGLYVDTYYGRKIERPPTTGEASNLVLAPGTRALDAIVADVAEGYLVTSWLGGNGDPTTGDFSLGLRGHALRGGQVEGAVQEMNVTGNVLSLFAHLVEVGSDPWVYGPRRVPTLVFEGVQFAGA